MVFAQGKEMDRSLDDLAEVAVGFAAAFGIENPQQFGVAVIAFGGIDREP